MAKKDNTILWIAGAIIAVILIFMFKPDMGTMSIIGLPGLSYAKDLDKDAPYQAPMKFGSDVFSISSASYDFENCGNGDYNAPEPRPECWSTIVNFQGQDINFIYGETKEINDFFLARFATSASVEEPDEDHSGYWIEQGQNLFTFEIYNKDFLEANILSQNTLIELNDDVGLDIKIRNDLANNMEGGLTITTTYYVENQVPTIETKNLIFKKGIQEYNIDLDSSKLGRVNVKIRPFVTIMGKEFHDDRTDELTFNIVPFIDEGAFSVDCTDTPCGKGFRCENINYENKEYNICIKGIEGELTKFNEWAIEKIDFRLVIGLVVIFGFLVYWANRR